MKKTLLFTAVLSLILQVSSAQETPSKFFVGINLFRYAPSSGGFYPDDNERHETSFLNGIDFSYQQNSWLGYTMGFRKISSYIHEFSIDSYQKLSTNGMEISLGPTVSSKELKGFSLTFAAEGFAEFTKVRGWQTAGDLTIYEESHRKNYFGFSSSLILNFKVTEFFAIYAKTRFRIGYITYTEIEDSYPEDPSLWGSQDFSFSQFDPLSGLGVRFSF